MHIGSYQTDLTRLPVRAAAFVALVCAAILGTSGWREWNSRSLTLKSAEVEMANLARSLTQHAEDSFDLLDSGILGVVTRLEIDGTGPETLSKLKPILVARKTALPRIFNIVICDENGDWLAAAIGQGSSIEDREFFLHHRQSPSRAAFIGKPVIGKVSNDWIITLSRRFNHPDGSFAGVVVATINAGYFADFYRQFETGTNGAISLLGAGGVIMARSPDNNTYVGRDLSHTRLFRDASSPAPNGVYYFKSPLNGVERLSYFQRSDRFPVVVVATAEMDEVLAPWRRAAIARMTFVLGLVVLIALMGRYLVGALLRGQRMAAALAAKEASFRVLAEGSSDLVTRIDLEERVTWASPSSVRIVGWAPEHLVGAPAMAGVNREDLQRVEQTVAALRKGELEEARISYRTRHKQKFEIWIESTLRVTRSESGEIDGVVGISRDVTQQKDLEEKLEALATMDSLTGLANRRRFDDRLVQEWGRAQREGSSLALLMIDVDHFKTFNDEYGHPAGDECLRAVARILVAEAQRTPDLAARYGGEEFAMLLPNTDAAGCERIGKRIRHAVRQASIPHALSLPSGLLTASLGGAACRPGSGKSSGHTMLVEAADRALYAAKAGGRDRLVMSASVVSLVPAMSAAE